MIAYIIDDQDMALLGMIDQFQKALADAGKLHQGEKLDPVSVNRLLDVRYMAEQLSKLRWLIITESRFHDALERLAPILQLRCKDCSEIKIAVIPQKGSARSDVLESFQQYAPKRVTVTFADLADPFWV
jgi:hypothetical protein